MTRPCLNPASVLFPERDEPMSDDELRTIPVYSMTRRFREEKPVVILNKDWRPPVFIGWGDDDGDD